MSKQVLSVADFALILNIVNERISRIEREEPIFSFGKTENEIRKEKARAKKERQERLSSPYYLQLKHLQNSLMNLNIEVETPEVKVEKEQKSCPNSICAMH